MVHQSLTALSLDDAIKRELSEPHRRRNGNQIHTLSFWVSSLVVEAVHENVGKHDRIRSHGMVFNWLNTQI